MEAMRIIAPSRACCVFGFAAASSFSFSFSSSSITSSCTIAITTRRSRNNFSTLHHPMASQFHQVSQLSPFLPFFPNSFNLNYIISLPSDGVPPRNPSCPPGTTAAAAFLLTSAHSAPISHLLYSIHALIRCRRQQPASLRWSRPAPCSTKAPVAFSPLSLSYICMLPYPQHHLLPSLPPSSNIFIFIYIMDICCQEHQGYPSASMVDFACHQDGSPILALSSLALHSKVLYLILLYLNSQYIYSFLLPPP